MTLVHKTFNEREWVFQEYPNGIVHVKIDDDRWLSAPDDRVTIGALINPPRTTEETEHVIEQMRKETGAQTLDWFTCGGTDIVFIKQSELCKAITVLDSPRIRPNVYE